MRSSTKWILELIVVAAISLGVGELVSRGLSLLDPAGTEPSRLEQVLVTLYILLVGLVIELIRWGRESVERAGLQVSSILSTDLLSSAERAVRAAILRTIIPSAQSDPYNANLHFSIIERYLHEIEEWPILIQRASSVLIQRHLASWDKEMHDLTTVTGLLLKMDETARMSSSMAASGASYVAIERTPCDPAQTWSPGYLRFLDELRERSGVTRRFILLAKADSLWGSAASPSAASEARRLFVAEEAYLRKRGFEVMFCDLDRVHRELDTTEFSNYNFEIFSDAVALQMDVAPTYDGELRVRLHVLPEIGRLRRFLQVVEEQGVKVTSRAIRSGQV